MHSCLVYVAMSWGNKMNFSFCVNVSAFCSDSYIYMKSFEAEKSYSYII